MKNTFGQSVCVTLFGESHGEQIGVVIDGLAPGVDIDLQFIRDQLTLRRPCGSISTARCEADRFSIVSGVSNGKSCGTPICILIPNEDTKSKDYSVLRYLARPGHADYSAECKYHGFQDVRGGGHFSGRLTAPLVAAGAIAIDALRKKGILIGTHIKRCAGIDDVGFGNATSDIVRLNKMDFAVLSEEKAELMKQAINDAAADGDSVGGILETMVVGMPSGVGEPWFDTMESVLSHMLFAVPGVKGVQFGLGFDFADKKGSEANDPFCMIDGKVNTLTNNNGGINGGITNGMPIIFSCAIKPTPSVYKTQQTVNFETGENTEITLTGRHDPAIIHRARVVVDSVTALTLLDMLALRFGTDWITLK